MEYILHEEISQLLIGNISTFLYGVYKFCWFSQILLHLKARTMKSEVVVVEALLYEYGHGPS